MPSLLLVCIHCDSTVEKLLMFVVIHTTSIDKLIADKQTSLNGESSLMKCGICLDLNDIEKYSWNFKNAMIKKTPTWTFLKRCRNLNKRLETWRTAINFFIFKELEFIDNLSECEILAYVSASVLTLSIFVISIIHSSVLNYSYRLSGHLFLHNLKNRTLISYCFYCTCQTDDWIEIWVACGGWFGILLLSFLRKRLSTFYCGRWECEIWWM